MDYQVDDSVRLAEPASQRGRRSHPYESPYGDDECSTDSGCSSGGSTGSAERLSRQNSGERLCEASGPLPKSSYCVDLERLRGRSTVSWTGEHPGRKPGARAARCSKSWSPENSRSHSCGDSPLHSQSPSDTSCSSDSDNGAQLNTFNSLFKVFQGLRISTGPGGPAQASAPAGAEKKSAHKKSPKRILRAPVSYTYVRGMSGLPTQRVPRNAAAQQSQMMLCSCHEFSGLY